MRKSLDLRPRAAYPSHVPSLSGRVSVLGAVALVAVAAVVASAVGAVAVGIEAVTAGVDAQTATARVRADLVLLAAAQFAGLIVATGLGTLAAYGNDTRFRDALDVRPTPAALIALALTAGAAMQFPLQELANALGELHPILRMPEEQQRALARLLRIDDWSAAILVPLAVVAIPAISEELLFRGLLLPGLARRYNARVAIAVSAILFGLMHVAPASIVIAAIAGTALAAVRIHTGSVLPCIAMHGAFNAVPLLLPARLVRIEGFNTVGDASAHVPAPLWITGALVAGVCLIMIARLTDDTDEL